MAYRTSETVSSLWAFAAAFLLICAAQAQIIIPPPHPIPPRPPRAQLQPAELRQERVSVKMTDGAVSTSVELVFFNPNNVVFEGDFLFEAPENAAIHSLTMLMNGKEVKAELLGSEEARRVYEDIVRRMKDPALLEFAGERLIRARVFPIPPGGEQRITLAYSHLIPAEDGLYTFRYPLRHKVSSDSPIKSFSIVMEIESQDPIKGVVSPTHKLDVVTQSDRKAKASFEAENLRSDSDLIVYVTVDAKDIGLKLLSYKETRSDGYFMAIISPGYGADKEGDAQEKSVVFAVDTSGSMASEEKIDQVKRALKYCLTHLNRGDRFNIVDFSTTARTFRAEPVAASQENIDEAVKYVDALEARGGTAISDALKVSTAMGKDVKTPFVLIFLTDGQPTIGTSDTQQLLDVVKNADSKALNLFTFGVGYDVNTRLLDRLAQENHGATTYALPGEDAGMALISLHRKISYPALTDVKLEFKGIRVYDMFPQTIPDLFRGTQLTVVGRYEGSGGKLIELSGALRGETKRFVNEGSFADDDTRNDWLPRAWATRKIGYLLDRMRTQGDNAELKDEVVRLSKEFGIMTPYTSLLVIEDEARHHTPTPMRLENMPTAARDAMQFSARGMAATAGPPAVGVSKELARMRSGDQGAGGTVMDESLRQAMRRVGSRTFYLTDGRWVVGTWDGKAETIKVVFLSDEYFRLAREKKELAEAFALGTKVIAESDGKFYELHD